jgi:peptidase MA superfamily protein
LRRGHRSGGRRRRALILRRAAALVAIALCGVVRPRGARAQDAPLRLDRSRFTALFYPSERTLAQSLISLAIANDTFPGLPRPTQHVLVAIAPDTRRFREWVGPHAPEWGAAVSFPESRRIVLQGRAAGAAAGDPREVFRHELAHLALHEYLGDLAPRWFDEGYASYAARETARTDALAANLALVVKGTPSFDQLDSEFFEGATTAQTAYALAYGAVDQLASLDTAHGLSSFFASWKREASMERAVRLTYGMTMAEFEQRWQKQTRRRYGGLALVGDVTLAGLLLLVIIVPLYVLRSQRDRRRMAALVEADRAAEAAARESAIEALLRGDEPPHSGNEPTESTPS